MGTAVHKDAVKEPYSNGFALYFLSHLTTEQSTPEALLGYEFMISVMQ